jgi:phosphoglucosamine mutase
MSRQYFGTDGIRGRVGEAPIVPEFALKLGWAAGKVLAASGKPSVVIGKDTRLSGYLLESALQSGLSAAGVDVRLLGPMPTPAVAHLTRAFHASAGMSFPPRITPISTTASNSSRRTARNCPMPWSMRSRPGSTSR